MRADLKQMKTDIRAEFEAVIDFVTNEQAQVATADQIERGSGADFCSYTS